MTKTLLIGILLTFCLPMAAQNDSTVIQNDSTINSKEKEKKKKERTVELAGEVYDSFTKAKIKAFVTLMRSDSTVVDTVTCMSWSTLSYYGFKVPAVQADYILKATAEGYEDTYMNYQLRHIARNSYFELPRILMKKKQDDIWKENDLEGVTVTGTRVKLTYKGDTLVFNASAFNLPEGSMLDGLIRQMPGAELKDNGDIYINGKKVDYLTLNGKDFFKGQNKVMLENLPYFTVKDIKVYNKSTKQSELVGRDIEKKDYVMDVELKREYNRGYLGNAEVGAGTDNRYLARLFGLYYSDHSRISLFGNTNNINETRRPGGEGEWTPSEMPRGLRTTKQTGFHLSTEDADKNWDETMDATFTWSDADFWSRNATERFAKEGNIMGGSESRSRQKDFNFNVSNQFTLQKPFTLYNYVTLYYGDGTRNTQNQDSTWQQAPINNTTSIGLNKYRTLNLNGLLLYYKKFNWGDFFSININANFSQTKPSDNFSRTETHYAQNLLDDLRNQYNDSHQDSYQYSIAASYSLQLPNQWSIEPDVTYKQSWNNSRNDLFRLDRLKDFDPQDIGTLPSSREQLMTVLDIDNSITQQLLTRTYTGRLAINKSDDKGYISFQLPVTINAERINYNDHHIDTIARRSYTLFTPSFNYYQWGRQKGLQYINYSMNVSKPSFATLMPHNNTANPLSTWVSNTGLKANVTHNLNIAFQFNNDSTKCFANIWASANITRNAWGTRTTYDKETGAYTLRNDNINGNWQASIGTNYQKPIDRKKLLTFKERADAYYNHSVDFPILYLNTGTASGSSKSTVNNWTLHDRLELEYQKDKLTATLMGDVTWRISTSDREDFERISAFDFSYGARLLYVIPWVKLSLATDIKMFSRRGYNSEMMNTNDLVWNAELSRSLFKEKLTLKLTAFDILHQLSNKQYTVNAQGRTETWDNCIPRYLMLTCAFKFNKTPNKN
ncbi:MAG: outer membrane beta-barrel protein [Prevotella sp.]|nr:outer membrane beta-barrel protein [Prevotella sp.]